MNTRELRSWWYFRMFDAEHTLFFPIFIEIEADSGVHGATVVGLEGQIVASGETASKAEQCALDLFMDYVEFGLANKKLDQYLRGTTVQHHKLQLRFDETDEWFAETQKILNASAPREARAREARDGWKGAPLAPETQELASAAN